MSKKNGNIFSVSVIKQTKKEFREDIRDAFKGSPELKKEIQKTLQQANRRIQNIEKAKLASPALKAVYAERGSNKGYSVFTISGLNPTNTSDWDLMKYEYGRALAFLNNPTSTATGARQYIKYQAERLNDIPFESANKIVDLATNPQIDHYGNVNIFHYQNILDNLKGDLMETEEDFAKDSNEYAKELESRLQQAIDETANKLYDQLSFLDRFF